MPSANIVAREAWLVARKELLAKEKAFTRARDGLAAERRKMPWVKLDKDYAFDTPDGRRALRDLFAGRGQLVIYHFMYGPDWKQGCKSCSFWADNFERIVPHLGARDVTLVAVSRAPLAMIAAFKARMGWTFPWVSSQGSDFNHDFGVSFDPMQQPCGDVTFNYERQPFPSEEAPGVSVFATDAAGAVFHTYSTYARGLDMLNTAYHYLDLVPRGRDEERLASPMQWVRLRDEYAN
ncbi:MAG: DUF899 domain-containing protein [Proteobacteria bacterium]|nr:DUF899 domain-containing protein [Pseudomonadota bacterium]